MLVWRLLKDWKCLNVWPYTESVTRHMLSDVTCCATFWDYWKLIAAPVLLCPCHVFVCRWRSCILEIKMAQSHRTWRTWIQQAALFSDLLDRLGGIFGITSSLDLVSHFLYIHTYTHGCFRYCTCISAYIFRHAACMLIGEVGRFDSVAAQTGTVTLTHASCWTWNKLLSTFCVKSMGRWLWQAWESVSPVDCTQN